MQINRDKRILDQVTDQNLVEDKPLGPLAGPWSSLILTLLGLSELEQTLRGVGSAPTSGMIVSQAPDAVEGQIKTLSDTFDGTQVASHPFPEGTRGFRIQNTGAQALRFAVDEPPYDAAWDGTFRVGQEIAAGEESEFRLIAAGASALHLWGTTAETYIVEAF